MVLAVGFGRDKVIYLNLDNNNKLILSGDVDVPVRRVDKLSWVIQDPKIISFRIERKPGNNRRLSTPDPEGIRVRDKLQVEIDYLIFIFGGDWKYTIYWTDQDKVEHPLDPKIPIKPVVSLRDTFFILGLLIVSLFSLSYYRKRRIAAATPAKNDLKNT